MSGETTRKQFPQFETDKEAEDFVDTMDLSEYDFSGFTSLNDFEFQPKNVSISMRLPQNQLDAVKAEAKRQGIPYQRFIRELIQKGMEALRVSKIRASS